MAYVKQNSGGERVTEGSFFVFFSCISTSLRFNQHFYIYIS